MSQVLRRLPVLVGALLAATHPTGTGVVAAWAQGDVTPAPGADEGAGGVIDPLGPNAGCYVCHLTLVRDDLSKVHLRSHVTCVECHGPSAQHANDEHSGATPPDTTYEREQVDGACRACHATHDVAAEQVIARWLERGLTEAPPVCTDCHGSHRIAAADLGGEAK